MIFVQIASYRDPELISTVLDLIKKCDDPKQLRVFVAWQHDDFETLDPIKDYVEYIDIPFVESKGVCWARNLIQKNYKGEEYTLQLDSHHRFVKGWDTILLEMYETCKNLGSSKPIITSYLPDFNPFTDSFIEEVWTIKAERFMDEGPLFLTPDCLVDQKDLKNPIPARFYSGHFSFTDGNFCKTVPHDPDYYFFGEETNISVRAFSHGYDLYHPNKIIGWHQYNRSYRNTHWNDHNMKNNEWWLFDNKSTKKFCLDFGIGTGKINETIFGKVRSFKEYEDYAGIRFVDKYISEYTLNNKIPPELIDEFL